MEIINKFTNDVDFNIEQRIASLFSKVYTWMSLGILITTFVAMYIGSQEMLVYEMMSNKIGWYGLIIVQFGLVWIIAGMMDRLSSIAAKGLFLLYSAIVGVTVSVIFVIYTLPSITTTFLSTAVMFGGMSLYGYFTKKDLSSWGSLLMMGLLGIIVSSIINWFLQSETLGYVISAIGVIIFVALTAYDTQKIKDIAIQGYAEGDAEDKLAIMGALSLYLDFINLFLSLLRLFGNRK
jgi:FtsH-binding integral membrane protein